MQSIDPLIHQINRWIDQGYAVGNGCTDPEFDGNALPAFARGKSLISATLYERLTAECGGQARAGGSGGGEGNRVGMRGRR